MNREQASRYLLMVLDRFGQSFLEISNSTNIVASIRYNGYDITFSLDYEKQVLYAFYGSAILRQHVADGVMVAYTVRWWIDHYFSKELPKAKVNWRKEGF